MAPLTTDEFVRRLEAMEAKLKKANKQVAFWRGRALVAETLMAASRPEATSEASDEEMEESAEEAAPPTASNAHSGPSTDSSDGEGFKSSNRRRKRIGPMSFSEEDKSSKKCALPTGRKPQPRDPRKAAQPAQQTRTSTQQPAKDVTKKQGAPAAQQTSTRRTKIPPIVLREKSKYDEITRKLMDSKVNYGCGITTKKGVRTLPFWILDNNKYQYHTYQLEEEKQLSSHPGCSRILDRGKNPGGTHCSRISPHHNRPMAQKWAAHSGGTGPTAENREDYI
uniref:Uncharacterized protein n=1 Tax=Dendroctonus ponderosae TaxID=77166 RepID=A0AAR5P8V9_DENPD